MRGDTLFDFLFTAILNLLKLIDEIFLKLDACFDEIAQRIDLVFVVMIPIFEDFYGFEPTHVLQVSHSLHKR